MKERTLTAKLSWDHFTDNIDKYCETVFGVDGQGQYPLSTEAVTAVLANYADNLTACLWNGDMSLDDGSSDKPASAQALALYDGFHTCVKHDIEDGIISEATATWFLARLSLPPLTTTTQHLTTTSWHGT